MDDVPPIPERFRRTIETGYDRRLHPYAVRGLRDYEDALDEWTDWVARLQEEEEQAPSAFDIVSAPLGSYRLDDADMEILYAGPTSSRQLAAQLGGELKTVLSSFLTSDGPGFSRNPYTYVSLQSAFTQGHFSKLRGLREIWTASVNE